MVRPAALAFASFVLPLLLGAAARAQGPVKITVETDRSHNTSEWANIAEHLPDPATATPAQLEMAADVLRARRYPEDAFTFYNAALLRGGEPVILLKKMGVACLELQQIPQARLLFERAVHLGKKDAGAWNNLGAADFMLRDHAGAIHAYKRAIKLQKASAVYHGNLALAYFDVKDASDARRELARALELDPDLLHHSQQDGYIAQIVGSEDYSAICFEMARVFAMQGNVEATLDWLVKASERGFDVRKALGEDATMRPLLADPRVQVIVKNAKTLRASTRGPVNVPSLGEAQQP